jgi:hypothetical protein
MILRLLVALLLLAPAVAHAAIAEVSGRKNTGVGNNVTSATCSLSANASSGNFVVVMGGVWNSGSGVTSVSVSSSGGGSTGAFSTILGATGVSYAGGVGKAFISYASVTGSGSLTFTVSTDVGSGNYLNLACDEFSGTAIALDVNGGEALASADNIVDTITTLTANDLIIGVAVIANGGATKTFVDGAGYTNIATDGSSTTQAYDAMFQVVTTATTYNVDWSIPGFAFDWSAVNAAFKEVTGGGGGGDTTPPSTPTNLVATATGSDRVSLTWSPSTDNVTTVPTYRLERAPFSGSCGTYAQIAAPTVTTYLDTGLAASTTYCYRVRAQDEALNLSSYSTAASATTLALRTLILYWNDNSPNAQNSVSETGFQMERCTGAACSDFAVLATLGANVTTYTDTVAPNPIAGYRVTALPAGSGYSNIVYSDTTIPPILLTHPPLLAFSAAPGFTPVPQSISITKNGGSPTMTWTVSDDQTWLSVSPGSGTDDAIVVASVDTTGLTAGIYTANITVTAAGATGSPQTIPVTLTMSSSGSSIGGRVR